MLEKSWYRNKLMMNIKKRNHSFLVFFGCNKDSPIKEIIGTIITDMDHIKSLLFYKQQLYLSFL